MKLTYIYHSGFVIEGKACTILIDFFKDTDRNGKGKVYDYFLKRPGKLYVLASHFHPDHFNRNILRWKDKRDDITYIFSDDILQNNRAKAEDAVYLSKFETYQDEMIRVKTYGSTDIGVSFLIEVEDKTIFHAGDLNNWHWREESTREESDEYELHFQRELEDITKEVKCVDVAMFPVDPRLGKDYMLGAEQFLDKIKVGLFVPMHFGNEYEKANAFKNYSKGKDSCFFEITEKGESIEF